MNVAWIGDGSSNMARSFVEAAALFGFQLRVAETCRVRFSGSRRRTLHDRRARSNSSAPTSSAPTCGRAWSQEAENEKRLRDFDGWTLDETMLGHAKPSAIVMHCLPAHRGEEIHGRRPRRAALGRLGSGKKTRLHVQKALMAFLLGWRP